MKICYYFLTIFDVNLDIKQHNEKSVDYSFHNNCESVKCPKRIQLSVLNQGCKRSGPD